MAFRQDVTYKYDQIFLSVLCRCRGWKYHIGVKSFALDTSNSISIPKTAYDKLHSARTDSWEQSDVSHSIFGVAPKWKKKNYCPGINLKRHLSQKARI